jgi:hypothetical protein
VLFHVDQKTGALTHSGARVDACAKARAVVAEENPGMPSRFISRTTTRPNGVSPPSAGVGRRVGPVVGHRVWARFSAVGERHVAAEGQEVRA